VNAREMSEGMSSNTIESPKRLSRRMRMRGAVLAATLASVLAVAAPASADFGIANFDGTVTQQNGAPATQAGSHPFEATTDIDFTQQGPGLPPVEMPKTIIVNLPAGLIGNPNAVPLCTREQFADGSLSGGGCPPESQVGTSTLKTTFSPLTFPVYAMEPNPGQPARFMFRALIPPVFIDARVRTESDYGLTVTIRGTSEALPLIGTSLTFWGVPADPAHDAERTCPGFVSPCASHAARKPFLTNPTSCTGPVTTSMSADSWQDPGDFKTASFVTHDQFGTPIGATGCDAEAFDPTISVAPTINSADSPSGLSVNLHVPQSDNPDGIATAHLKNAVVTLPEGVSVNPSAADGLGACTTAQIGIGSADEPTCPDSSKIGTATVDTPLLPDPMKGSIYLAQQGSNPFNSLLAVYIVPEGHGVILKLPAKIEADPATGQLKTTIENAPQLPFSDFNLTFDGGPRGALAMPGSCASFTTTSQLTPWNGGAAVTPSSSFSITNDCGGGFSPTFLAGSTNTSAGRGPRVPLHVSRSDGQQHLKSLSATLPPGLLANVGSVPPCADAAAAAGTCDAASQVGTTSVATGAGSTPFYLPGRVYLTGPYKGAPYGLSIVVPALAGPFNLGTVVVRAAITVDPNDAHLTVVSDDLPSILQGIPLRLRKLEVDIDKQGFMTNPTSCAPMTVNGSIASIEGSTATVSSPFQVGGCASLPFAPAIAAKLTGSTKKGGTPGLDVTLKSAAGQANLRTVALTLPKFLGIPLGGSVCTQAQLAADNCPAASKYGTATAATPLLPSPLSGPVYLVSPSGGGLPSLFVRLTGSGLTVNLTSKTELKNGALKATFQSIPDVAISDFKLSLKSGSGALLKSSAAACSSSRLAAATLVGQNGKRVRKALAVSASCKASKKSNKARKGSRKHR
jgi:hypothetical protein